MAAWAVEVTVFGVPTQSPVLEQVCPYLHILGFIVLQKQSGILEEPGQLGAQEGVDVHTLPFEQVSPLQLHWLGMLTVPAIQSRSLHTPFKQTPFGQLIVLQTAKDIEDRTQTSIITNNDEITVFLIKVILHALLSL